MGREGCRHSCLSLSNSATMKTVLILSLLLAIAATALAGPRSTAYSLTIELSDDDIKFLNEIGYSICIVRDVVGFDLSSVWHAIPPRQLSQEIELQWEEQFYVFHEETVYEAGDVLRFNSEVQTPLEQAWVFDTTFEDFKTPVASGSVLVVDKHQSVHSLGLAQIINGQVKALGSIPSSNGISVQLTPKEYIYVFIGRNKQSELLDITAVSNPIKVEYFGTTSQKIKFHRNDAKFILRAN